MTPKLRDCYVSLGLRRTARFCVRQVRRRMEPSRSTIFLTGKFKVPSSTMERPAVDGLSTGSRCRARMQIAPAQQPRLLAFTKIPVTAMADESLRPHLPRPDGDGVSQDNEPGLPHVALASTDHPKVALEIGDGPLSSGPGGFFLMAGLRHVVG